MVLHIPLHKITKASKKTVEKQVRVISAMNWWKNYPPIKTKYKKKY